jgi:AsmA protein
VLVVQAINGDMKTLNLKGKGKIYPLTEKLDIELGLRISGDLNNKESACRANSKYRDIYWPVQCKGSFADEPAKLCKIDKDKLAKISANAAKDELKDKAKDKAQDFLNKLLNK